MSDFEEELHALLKPISTTGELKICMIEGGWRIKQTQHHYIDVMRMMFNYRIVTTPVSFPMVYDRHWCYQGTDSRAFTHAVVAAAMWDGSDDTEPEGWNKNGQTGEWREK